MNSINAAVAAVPITLLVVSNMASNTANISGADKASIQKTIYVTGGALLAAACVSQNGGAIIATALSLAAVVFVTKPLWFGA